MSDMISRDAAIGALEDRRDKYQKDSQTWLQIQMDILAIRAIPAADADPVCTGCGGTGVTYQTERRCACQGPDLTDPVTVHANMLRGSIAKPTVEQIVHLYGCEAFQPMIDAAIAKALERACLAVSEHADWPEDEHGRTEQVELFARVINAIRAITPALSPSTDARAEALREAAEMIDKRHRGSLPDHIKSEDGNAIRAMIKEAKT